MARFVRLCTLFLMSAAALLLATAGCSKNPDTSEVGLTQQEADDLSQQVGALAATNLGGWLTEVRVVSASVPAGTALAAEAAGLPRVLTDTTFTVAGMNWLIHRTYQHPAGDTVASYDTSAVHAFAIASAHGTMTIPGFATTVGTTAYGHDSSDVTASQLSAFTVRDTALSFLGFCTQDTALTTITGGGTTRYYFVDNVLEYDDITVLRGAGAPVFPVAGEASIAIAFEVLNGLRHVVPTDKKKLGDAVMLIDFNRADPQHVAVSITANTSTPTTVYHYHLDLASGALSRN